MGAVGWIIVALLFLFLVVPLFLISSAGSFAVATGEQLCDDTCGCGWSEEWAGASDTSGSN